MKVIVDTTMLSDLLIIDNFTGKTFGELKEILNTNDAIEANMKVVIGETRNTLEVDSAILPELEEITLFISPNDTKAGSDDIDKILLEINQLVEKINNKLNENTVHFAPKNKENNTTITEIKKELIDSAMNDLQELRSKL